MKWEYWIIILALLVVLALGAMAGLNTVIGQQQDELAARALEVAALEAQVADLQDQLRPPPYCEPLEGARISSGCGYRVNPLGGSEEALHRGIDLAAPEGTPVYAVVAGRVVEHWVPPDGKRWKGHSILGGMIIIDHGGFFMIYGHLRASFIHTGDWVEMGQIIGEVGNTGISTGNHLHFEVVANPIEYLEIRK